MQGVGIDIVDTGRIARLIDLSDRFDERWFTHDEAAQCRREPSPADAFAMHLAAKEAVLKALGMGPWTGPVPWRDIAISGTRDAAVVVLTGEVAAAAARAGAGRISVSFLAIPGMALAVAMVEQSASDGFTSSASGRTQSPDTPD